MSSRAIGARRTADRIAEVSSDGPPRQRSRLCHGNLLKELKRLEVARDFSQFGQLRDKITVLQSLINTASTEVQSCTDKTSLLKLGDKLATLNLGQLRTQQITAMEEKAEQLMRMFVSIDRPQLRKSFSEIHSSVAKLRDDLRTLLTSYWMKGESLCVDGSFPKELISRVETTTSKFKDVLTIVQSKPWLFCVKLADAISLLADIAIKADNFGAQQIALSNSCQSLVNSEEKTKLTGMITELGTTIESTKISIQSIVDDMRLMTENEAQIVANCTSTIDKSNAFSASESACLRKLLNKEPCTDAELSSLRLLWSELSALNATLSPLLSPLGKENFGIVATSVNAYNDAILRLLKIECLVKEVGNHDGLDRVPEFVECSHKLEQYGGDLNRYMMELQSDTATDAANKHELVQQTNKRCCELYGLVIGLALNNVSFKFCEEEREKILDMLSKAFDNCESSGMTRNIVNLERKLSIQYPQLCDELASIRCKSMELSAASGMLTETETVALFQELRLHELESPTLQSRSLVNIIGQWSTVP